MLAVSAWDRLLVGDDCSMICRNAVPGRARGYVAGMSEEYRKKTLWEPGLSRNNGNRTEWSSIRSVIMRVINKTDLFNTSNLVLTTELKTQIGHRKG